MRFRRDLRIEASIPTTSLADIVFLLLIFFIISTTFITQPAIKIKLPEATIRELEPTEAVIVFLDAGGRVYINEQEVPWDKNLSAILKTRIYASREKLVVIKADRDVNFGKVVKVMDISKQAGAQKLAVATRHMEEETER